MAIGQAYLPNDQTASLLVLEGLRAVPPSLLIQESRTKCVFVFIAHTSLQLLIFDVV